MGRESGPLVPPLVGWITAGELRVVPVLVSVVGEADAAERSEAAGFLSAPSKSSQGEWSG
jgi:hypothetical protein